MRMRQPARRAPDYGAYHSLFRCPARCQEPLRRSAGDPSFLDLPRHRRAVPASRARPARASTSASAGRTSRSARQTSRCSRPLARRCAACAAAAPLPSPWLLAATAGLRASCSSSPSLPNGADAIITAGKLAEFGGTDARRRRLPRLARAAAALARRSSSASRPSRSAGALVGFIGVGPAGARARSWASTTWPRSGRSPLAVGLARLHAAPGGPGLLGDRRDRGRRPRRRARRLARERARRSTSSRPRSSLTSRCGAATCASARRSSRSRVAAVATAGTLALRHGELGFLQSWFGPPPERPGEYAASWSQRLIYTYIGGRVFLDQPCSAPAGTASCRRRTSRSYLPDARERFPDQPPHYFPPHDGDFIPQQTYDQVLFELGLVGGAFFRVLLAVLAVARAARWPRGAAGADAAYVPAAWLARARRARSPAPRSSAARPDRDLLADARRRRAADVGAGSRA